MESQTWAWILIPMIGHNFKRWSHGERNECEKERKERWNNHLWLISDLRLEFSLDCLWRLYSCFTHLETQRLGFLEMFESTWSKTSHRWVYCAETDSSHNLTDCYGLTRTVTLSFVVLNFDLIGSRVLQRSGVECNQTGRGVRLHKRGIPWVSLEQQVELLDKVRLRAWLFQLQSIYNPQ